MIKTRRSPKARRRPEVRPRAPRGKGRAIKPELSVRVDSSAEKEHIQKAADALELSLNQFAVRAMLKEADEVLGHSAGADPTSQAVLPA